MILEFSPSCADLVGLTSKCADYVSETGSEFQAPSEGDSFPPMAAQFAAGGKQQGPELVRAAQPPNRSCLLLYRFRFPASAC